MSKLTIFENTGFRGEKSKIQGGKKKIRKHIQWDGLNW